MKNIHILPTSNSSRLAKHSTGSLHMVEDKPHKKGLYKMTNQNIYITSNEEIKEGDWILVPSTDGETYFDFRESVPKKAKWDYASSKFVFKIILTTDQDLIKDGVQSIDDEFLEWFVKNPNCEFVEVEELCGGCGSNDGDCWRSKECNKGYFKNKYKIIISKEEPKFDDAWLSPMQRFKLRENKPNEEEPKQEYDIKESNRLDDIEIEKMSNDWETMSQQIKPKQETFEEAARRYYEDNIDQSNIPREHYELEIQELMTGFAYNWQAERSYSEEEVWKLVNKLNETLNIGSDLTLEQWFEKFKKK